MVNGITRRRICNRYLGIACAFSMIVSIVPGATAQNFDTKKVLPATNALDSYASTHIVVQATPCFCQAMTNAMPDQAQSVAAAAQHVMSPELDATCQRWGVTNMRPAFRFGFAHPELAAKHGLDQFFVVDTAPGTDTVAMAADFAMQSGEIAAASVDMIGRVSAVIPNDTDFGIQWGMDNTGTVPSGPLTCVADADVDAPEAWDITTGNVVDPVIIAIIDSGVEPHAEFAGRMVPGISTGDADPTDTGDDCSLYHGTHVAGIAAASGNNGTGVAGMCWNCQIMPVDVLFNKNDPACAADPLCSGCSGATVNLANGIIWAADHGADVMNISLQFYNQTALNIIILQNAIRYAHDLGVVIVAATGNNAGNTVAYPAVFPETIAVGGITCQDQHAENNFSTVNWTSNWGPETDVAAPGDRIWSTGVNDGYRFLNGTSMATPHVTGLAALIRSIEPTIPNTAVARLLEETAVDVIVDMPTIPGFVDTGWDEKTGYGRVNALAALLAAPDYPRVLASNPPSGAIDARRPHDPNDTGIRYGWDSVEMTFPANAADVMPQDFEVVQNGAIAAAPPVVDSIMVLDDQHIRVFLDKPIEPGVWTSIIHTSSQTRVDLGYMPADVNGDTTATPADILDLIDALNGVGDPRDIWSIDVDRSGLAGAPDILDVVDLLNGAGLFDPYLNQRLPVITP